MYKHYNNNQTSLTLPLEISISETIDCPVTGHHVRVTD